MSGESKAITWQCCNDDNRNDLQRIEEGRSSSGSVDEGLNDSDDIKHYQRNDKAVVI